MPTYRLQLLDFEATKISGPKAHIVLKAYSTVSYKDMDFKAISSECVNYQELEYAANLLIKELESIKKQAKKHFGS